MRIPRGRTIQLAKSLGVVGAALLLISIAFMVWARGSTDGIRVFGGDDFYDPLDPLPTGEPGDIIWIEPLNLSVGVGWRILYHSRSLDQRDIAVSGIVLAPSGEPPSGGWPVLAWAHGTTGIEDPCAPSRSGTSGGTSDGFLEEIMREGYVVVATDYEGLGTPGPHPWLVGESEARSVLDIVRAARQLEETGASGEFVVWGHSQGGQAALFTGEIAQDWAPELELKGVIASAPTFQLAKNIEYVTNTPFHGFVVMLASAYDAVYQEADMAMLLREEALETLRAAGEACVGEVLERFASLKFDDIFAQDITTTEPWRRLLIQNQPGSVRTAAPILIVHGSSDPLIPVDFSHQLSNNLCALDDVVQLKVYEGRDHQGVVPASLRDVSRWISDRFEGLAAPDDCEG